MLRNMFPFSLSLWLQVPLYIVSLHFTYKVYWELTAGATLRRKAEAAGCKPAKLRTSRFWGLNNLFEKLRAGRNHTMLESSQRDFKTLEVSTLRFDILGTPVWCTIEPANIQSMLASNFNAWCVGTVRQLMLPITGGGIFTSDGAQWRHSRELLRPSFHKSAQTNKADLFERHLEHFFRKIPSDGATVDLQPLFFCMAMDISTEFLFGESTNTLAAEDVPPETAEFVAAWDRAAELVGGAGVSSFVAAILPNSGLKKDRKTIHGKLLACRASRSRLTLSSLRRRHRRPRRRCALCHQRIPLLRINLAGPLHLPRHTPC